MYHQLLLYWYGLTNLSVFEQLLWFINFAGNKSVAYAKVALPLIWERLLLNFSDIATSAANYDWSNLSTDLTENRVLHYFLAYLLVSFLVSSFIYRVARKVIASYIWLVKVFFFFVIPETILLYTSHVYLVPLFIDALAYLEGPFSLFVAFVSVPDDPAAADVAQ